jgi:hypothetical protein
MAYMRKADINMGNTVNQLSLSEIMDIPNLSASPIHGKAHTAGLAKFYILISSV